MNHHPQSVQELLEELENLLQRERLSLQSLDIAAVEQHAEEKLALDERLREAAETHTATEADRKLLMRVRASAQINQVLLVHARSCVQGIIQLVSGEQPPLNPGGHSKVAPRPIAVNIRG